MDIYSICLYLKARIEYLPFCAKHDKNSCILDLKKKKPKKRVQYVESKKFRQ